MTPEKTNQLVQKEFAETGPAGRAARSGNGERKQQVQVAELMQTPEELYTGCGGSTPEFSPEEWLWTRSGRHLEQMAWTQ